MKIGIYSPYLDTLGGGEKYIGIVAEHLSINHTVDIFWSGSHSVKQQLCGKLNLDLDRVNFTPNIFADKNLFSRILKTNKYDRIIFLSDGSIPFIFAKKNILHFQVPFQGKIGILDKIKLLNIRKIICNSFFTKRYVDKTYGFVSQVVYPPVDTALFVPGIKQNIILSVGRFTQTLHSKKQEVLIDAFRKLTEAKVKGWKLRLIGNAMPGDNGYISKLREESAKLPVEIVTNASLSILKNSYAEAKIYWHAAGFGENESHPEKMEHFGISTVEAMSAMRVPIVFKAGGQIEIVANGENGFLWENKDELVSRTKELIENNNKRESLAFFAQKRSRDFNKGKFCEKIDEIIA